MILDLNTLKEKYNLQFNGVLHIGAHYGKEYHTYKKLQINPIIFIEALPTTYEILSKNVGEECICLNTAIGNCVGTVDMFVDEANQGGSSSVLEPDIHLQQYPHITFSKKVTVPITRVDNLDIPKCNFFNIDVQGYELEVLKGATNYLKHVDYLMSEVNRASVYKNCALVEELDTFLANYNLHRQETSWDGNTWGDAFYIKK